MNSTRYILLFIAILTGIDCYSQREKIDSLKQLLFSRRDSARIDCLNALSDAYAFFEKDSARLFAEKALQEAQKINFRKGIAESWINIAWSNWVSDRDLISIEKFSRNAILLLENTEENKLLADSWYFLGVSMSLQGKFSAAIAAFDKAGLLFAKIGDKMGEANMYAYMADAERNRGQYSKSLEYSVKWLEIANKYEDQRYIDVWAALYSIVGDYETALEYYSQAAAIAREGQQLDELVYFTKTQGEIFLLQEKYDSARYYFNLIDNYMPQFPPLDYQWGTYYLALKNYDSALFHLKNALVRSKNNNELITIPQVLTCLSKFYKETGKTKLSIQHARELLIVAKKTGARQHIRDGHQLLYQLFDQSGDRDSTLYHLKKYTGLKEAIDKDLSAQKLGFYKIRAEQEKAQSKITLLNEEKKLQQLQLNQTNQEKKFLVLAIAALGLMGIVFFRNLTLKRKNEKQSFEHELEIQTLESEKTKAELQHQATELEMQALRAQMNPHFIFNSLNSINKFILQNHKAQASEYLTKFSKLIRLILQNSQSALIPLESELQSLHLYLELEAIRFDHHFDFTINVDDELDTDIIKVPPLIIQPYAENAIWHGLMNKEDKGHLEIKLFAEGESLCCRITDDGIGRVKAAELKSKSHLAHKSMGMQITASRIEKLQQKKQLEAHIKITDLVLPAGSVGGTEVLLKIPVLS